MNIENIKEILFSSKKNIAIFLITSFLLTYSYFYAITTFVPFSTFLQSNSADYVILQISLSIINALLGGVAIVLIVESFRIQKMNSKLNFIQTTLSLFISIATTGCYICGSILLPSLGIAASFAALPLGGLEVKVLTIVLLLYSINDLNKKILGICKIYRIKFVILESSLGSLKINTNIFHQAKPFAITGFMIALILILPAIFPKVGFSINDPKVYKCLSSHNSFK